MNISRVVSQHFKLFQCLQQWACLSILGLTAPAWAQADLRFNLRLSASEQVVFLSEMRTMLGSVQGIVQGLAMQDRAAIAKFARVSGNQMARATPASIRAKLPLAFAQLGPPTHMAFEELAIRAETDDMDQLAQHLSETMQLCMACHAAFQVGRE